MAVAVPFFAGPVFPVGAAAPPPAAPVFVELPDFLPPLPANTGVVELVDAVAPPVACAPLFCELVEVCVKFVGARSVFEVLLEYFEKGGYTILTVESEF